MSERCLLALLLLPFAAEAAPKRTLAELIRLAEERAHPIRVAQAQVEVTRIQRSEARRLLAPTGELLYNLTGTPRIECRGLAGDAGPNRTRECLSTVDPSTGNAVTRVNFGLSGIGMHAELRFNQPLFTFGKIHNAMRGAAHSERAMEAQLLAARMEVELNATRAYWSLKAARTSRATLESFRDEILPWIDRIERELDEPQPQFTLNDLQRMKIALAQVDLLLAEAKCAMAIAQAGFVALLGEEVEIDDEELNPVVIADRTVEEYRRAVQTHRPEVRALDEGVEAARSTARLRIAEMLPDIGVSGIISARYAPAVEDWENAFVEHANGVGYRVLLGIRQPLDLVERYARLRHARADAELAAARRRLVRTAIDLGVDQAYADLSEARNRTLAAERGQRIARGWLTAVQQNLDLGTAEPRDLIDAARHYFELRLRYIQGILDLNNASAQLRRAAGIDVAS